ncbi:MAG: hypothetical protein ACRBFS_25790 [Aureispira sp.]
MRSENRILSKKLEESAPSLVALSFEAEKAITLKIKVRKSWHIVKYLVVFIIIFCVFFNLPPLFVWKEATLISCLLMTITGGILFLTVLPIIIWIGGHNQVKLTPEGIEQCIYVGQWRLARIRTVSWNRVQMIALVMTDNSTSYQEVQVLKKTGEPFLFKQYYATEQLFYLEQCLQAYFKYYKNSKKELDAAEADKIDWYDHLIE